MNKLRCVIGFLLMMMSVSACVSQQSRLEKGQASFQRQDYYQAFQRLKSIAKAGNPEAQYAIGYMYYYGKGVLEDKAEAKRWMKKAAVQHQPQAQQALRLIAKKTSNGRPVARS